MNLSRSCPVLPNSSGCSREVATVLMAQMFSECLLYTRTVPGTRELWGGQDSLNPLLANKWGTHVNKINK